MVEPWTEPQRKAAVDLWRKGGTAQSISDILSKRFGASRTRNAVIGKLNKLDLLGTRPRTKQKRCKPGSVAEMLSNRIHASGDFGKCLPLPPDEPIPPTAVTLADRAPHQCAWPVNHGGPYLYCGAATNGRRYCAHHEFISLRKNEELHHAPSLDRSECSSRACRTISNGHERY